MEKIMDRRARRTRKALHEALLRLILTKGYDELTVQDIVEEADVGRSTFYAHYTGKDDLHRSGFETLHGELAEARRAAQSQGRDDAPLAFSLVFFEHVSRYTDIYLAMAGRRGGNIARSEIRDALLAAARKDVAARWTDDAIARELGLEFVVATLLTVTSWWMERSPHLKPAEVDAIFRRLALAGAGKSFRNAARR